MEHWLLYESDREFGGRKILGIFSSSEDAWKHWREIADKNHSYWYVPHVEHWQDAKLIEYNYG